MTTTCNLLILSLLTTCASCSPGTGLTKENAQQAVNTGLVQLPELAARKGMQLQGSDYKAEVLGIQENPTENSATADIKFYNMTFKPPGPLYPMQTLDKGTASFKRYSDGRWVLTEIHSGDGRFLGSFEMNIEASR